jgi:hypothetical protein
MNRKNELRLPPLPAVPLGPMPTAAKMQLAADWAAVSAIPDAMTHREAQEWRNRAMAAVWASLCFASGFTPREANYNKKAKYHYILPLFVAAVQRLGYHGDDQAVESWLAPPAARLAAELHILAAQAIEQQQRPLALEGAV